MTGNSAEDRERRRAEALRANLKRRKAQARAQAGGAGDDRPRAADDAATAPLQVAAAEPR